MIWPATTVSLPKLCVAMPVRTQNHPFPTVSDPSGTPRTHLGPTWDPPRTPVGDVLRSGKFTA